jgi:PAS domain S-box-containing protein
MEAAELTIDFLSAIEITSDIIFFTDKGGGILYVNPAFEKITGYSKEEVIGKNPRILQSSSLPKSFYENMWKTLLLKQPFRGIVTNKKKNGELYYEEKTITPISDSTGNITHFTSSGKDITERIVFENKQEELLTKLERANKELESFNRILAHDLKNPLASIIMAAKYIFNNCENIFTKEEKEIFILMQDRAAYMNELIKDLLELARAGHNTDELEHIDLNLIVKRIIDEYASMSSVKFRINDMLPAIMFNKTHITQVFENLISNAVKYMDKPAGEIKIGCEKTGDSYKFYIADNGPGIEEKYLNKIFQPFEKAHDRKDIQSTGIGLSIVKKIIENSGGGVWVESEIGQGSTFYFEIPKKSIKS